MTSLELTLSVVERDGHKAGAAAGSWIIDGNTTVDTAWQIMHGYEDGDPEILDMQPSPFSGEWADGPVLAGILARLDVDPNDDADAWSEVAEQVATAYETGYADRAAFVNARTPGASTPKRTARANNRPVNTVSCISARCVIRAARHTRPSTV